MVKKSVVLRSLLLILFVMLLTACDAATEDEPLIMGAFQPVTAHDLRIVAGQTVYVPAYSAIFYGNEGASIDLSVTLAIHNADLNEAIIIQSVEYYDTDGTFVRDYVDEPVEIASLATTGFRVRDTDLDTGWGGNFIVQWVAEQPVYEPIIEAIMISTRGNQGISFISPGRVITQASEATDGN